MTPAIIRNILTNKVVEVGARVLLTFPFWAGGIGKFMNFPAAAAEFHAANIYPAIPFVILTVIVEIGGSVLVILNRWTWLGAGALGVFTALTIPLVHHFWTMQGDEGMHALYTASEHVGMIGGLIIVSILSTRPKT
jgi:transmembrane protein